MSTFNILSKKQVLDSYVASIKAEFDGSKPEIRKSLFNIFGRGLSLIIHGNYIWLFKLSDVPFVASCPVEFLPLHGSENGVPRKAAAGAIGDVVATGVDGSAISIGDRLVAIDGSNLQYEATEAGVIAAGTFTFAVRSLNFGVNTNKAESAKLEFVSPALGVDTSATVDTGGLVSGADEEDAELWRQRILFQKRNPPACGTPADYIRWALQVPEVTRAFAFPRESGNGTVTVRFMMDNKYGDGIPQAGDLTVVKAHIETQMPAQVQLFVPAPVAQPLAIAITLLPNTGDVQTAVTASIKDLIARDARPGGTILLSKIRQAVSNATGENDNTVTSPVADVTVPSDAEIVTFTTPTYS